jgi:hypothetical protein
MKNSDLVMKLEITVAGGLGWQRVIRSTLESIGQLVEEANLLEAKGDSTHHTFQYKIIVGKNDDTGRN